MAWGGRPLTDVELIGLVLGVSSTGSRAEAVARDLVDAVGGLSGIAHRTPSALTRIPGVGAAHAARLWAACEIGQRAWRGNGTRRPITTPEQVADSARDLVDARREQIVALLLDAQSRLIRTEIIAVGSLNVARATPRDVVEIALVSLACGIVLVHNHPSGSSRASPEDVRFTEVVARAATLLGLTLHDHVIVARDGFCSLWREGRRWSRPGTR